jgi:hypothetical protein
VPAGRGSILHISPSTAARNTGVLSWSSSPDMQKKSLTVFPAFHRVCCGVQFVLISQIAFKQQLEILWKGCVVAQVSSENSQPMSLLIISTLLYFLCLYGRRKLTSFCCFPPFGSVGLKNVMLHLFGPVLFWLDVFVCCILASTTMYLRIV